MIISIFLSLPDGITGFVCVFCTEIHGTEFFITYNLI